MNGTNLFEYCKDAANDGTSVWVFQGKKHLTYLASRLKSIPKFNSNYTYCIINSRHGVQILGDYPYTQLKVFFWVGARVTDYDSHFEQISQDIQDFIQEQNQRTKARIYIEFQYAESTQFFALFKRFNYATSASSKQFCCIQYQDYAQASDRRTIRRAIPFPKYLLLERATADYDTQQDVFIRIHEKPTLDFKSENLAIISLDGCHVDRQGNETVDMNAPFEINEEIRKISFAIGGEVDEELARIAHILAQSYKVKYPKAIVSNADWDAFVVEGKNDLPRRNEEPYRVKRFQPNHQIETTWEEKKKAELEAAIVDPDLQLTRFKVTNPFDIQIVKKAIDAPLDHNSFTVFKVGFEERSDYISTNKRSTRNTSFVHTVKDKFQMQFQELEIENFDSSCLSEYFVYLLYTPVSIYLWLGNEIDEDVRTGALSIIKAFLQEKIPDKFDFQPSYQTNKKFNESIKVRLEFQGYESQAFISHLGQTSAMPVTDDANGYLMLRRPKHAYWVSQKEIDMDNFQANQQNQEQSFEDMMTDHFDNPRGAGLTQQLEAIDYDRVKSSMHKQTIKNTASEVKSRMGDVLALRQTKNDAFDLDAMKEKQKYMDEIAKAKRMDQQNLLHKIRAEFNPLSCIASTLDPLKDKKALGIKDKYFDAIWTFDIIGGSKAKFEQQINPLEMGVFKSAHSYFIVCFKQEKIAIYLWRGKNQTLYDSETAIELFIDTKFRSVANDIEQKSKASRAVSAISSTGIGGLNSGKDSVVHKNTPKDEVQALKSTFKPINSTGATGANKQMLLNDHITNLNPLHKDTKYQINLRSLVTMDHEPQHFLQVFQGAFVVTTDEYLTRKPKSYSDDPDSEETFVMLFELVGQPCLNQRAREVPPFRSSLASQGLYLMIGKARIIFWIGHDFYDCYLDAQTYNKQSELIHEELLNKILFIYEQATNARLEEVSQELLIKFMHKKIYYSVENLDIEFDEYIDGEKIKTKENKMAVTRRVVDEVSEDSESDNAEYMLNYQSKVVKDFHVPLEPKLFPLFVNGKEVDYGIASYEDADLKSQAKRLLSEMNQFNQIHNFHQAMLHQAGVYLLDFESLAFIWVGKSVPKDIVPSTFKLACDALLAVNCKGKERMQNMSLNLVFYGFEPEVFKSAFRQGWRSLDQPGLDNKQEISQIQEQDDEEDDYGEESIKVTKKPQINLSREQAENAARTLISESYWIN